MSILGDTFMLPASACPICGFELEACTNAGEDEGAPRPNDITLCGRCAAVLLFGPDMHPHAATEEELAAIPLDTYVQVQTVRTALLQMQAAKGQM